VVQAKAEYKCLGRYAISEAGPCIRCVWRQTLHLRGSHNRDDSLWHLTEDQQWTIWAWLTDTLVEKERQLSSKHDLSSRVHSALLCPRHWVPCNLWWPLTRHQL
jgi:hypothetical protein